MLVRLACPQPLLDTTLGTLLGGRQWSKMLWWLLERCGAAETAAVPHTEARLAAALTAYGVDAVVALQPMRYSRLCTRETLAELALLAAIATESQQQKLSEHIAAASTLMSAMTRFAANANLSSFAEQPLCVSSVGEGSALAALKAATDTRAEETSAFNMRLAAMSTRAAHAILDVLAPNTPETTFTAGALRREPMCATEVANTVDAMCLAADIRWYSDLSAAVTLPVTAIIAGTLEVDETWCEAERVAARAHAEIVALCRVHKLCAHLEKQQQQKHRKRYNGRAQVGELEEWAAACSDSHCL